MKAAGDAPMVGVVARLTAQKARPPHSPAFHFNPSTTIVSVYPHTHPPP